MARYVALDAPAYAERVGCSLASAYRDFERFLAQQGNPKIFRMRRRKVRIGSGAIRERLVVLMPPARRAANDDR